MEDTFEALLEYHNRQVVINIYQDEELCQKEGMRFDLIELEPDKILFIRENRVITVMPKHSTDQLIKLNGFPRYYSFMHHNIRTELYFP